MMDSRTSLAEQIAALAGEDVLRIVELRDGWPALADLTSPEGENVPVSLFASRVGLSHRGRDDVERRFQNPGSQRPIVIQPDRYPVLLGLWSADIHIPVPRPLLVSADPFRRAGRMTRFSVFVTLTALTEAASSGWSTSVNDSEETIRCMLPQLLPVSVAADRQGTPPALMVQNAIAASGLTDPTSDPAASDRARRATMALIRDARFSDRVLAAYDGRCAMCGLASPLVQGAHIYPASAPGSQDEPWNGLALCPNHHVAFDRHLIGILPETGEIWFKDEMHHQSRDNRALSAFLQTTMPVLAAPIVPEADPPPSVFYARYEYFTRQYDWLR